LIDLDRLHHQELKCFYHATNCILIFVAIVSFGKVDEEQKEEVSKYGVSIYSWDEFMSLVR
jgi:hypothetical protein